MRYVDLEDLSLRDGWLEEAIAGDAVGSAERS